MKKLIYLEDAIDAVERAKTARSADGEIYCAKINAQMNIQLLPPAQLIKSDIIQCGYCTHHVPPAYCKENDGIWRPFDYCSKAERKKNEYDIQTGCD